MTEPKRHVVKPFGLIGGDYEVDGAGPPGAEERYTIAVVVIGVAAFRNSIGETGDIQQRLAHWHHSAPWGSIRVKVRSRRIQW